MDTQSEIATVLLENAVKEIEAGAVVLSVDFKNERNEAEDETDRDTGEHTLTITWRTNE
jgi:hypothetical protein